jgi:hypothetical protein
MGTIDPLLLGAFLLLSLMILLSLVQRQGD